MGYSQTGSNHLKIGRNSLIGDAYKGDRRTMLVTEKKTTGEKGRVGSSSAKEKHLFEREMTA